jgi:hypothetical protein
MDNKWINLSEGVFLFGPGGINRIEPMDKRDGVKTPYQTVLYSNLTKISVVKETIEEIVDKLEK